MNTNNCYEAHALSAGTHPHLLIALLFLLLVPCKPKAEDYLNNLANIFQDGTNAPGSSIGDCENLGADGWYAVEFFTGDSSSNAVTFTVGGGSNNIASFQLNWVTCEFLGNHMLPFADVYVELYQQVGTNSVLLGELGTPAIDSRKTEWPGETTYVDYLPSRTLCLQPNSQYSIKLSTTTFQLDIWFPALIFTWKTNYVAMGGWQLGATTASNVALFGNEALKFAVDVTPSPEPCSTSGTSSNVFLSATQIGKKLSLIWPASPYMLYATESLNAPVWTQISTTPFRSNYNLVVSIPLTNNSQYFQLRAP